MHDLSTLRRSSDQASVCKRGPEHHWRSGMKEVARISGISTRRVDLPLEIPVITPMHEIRSISCLLVTVTADNGTTGEGFAFCFGKERLLVIEAMVHALRSEIIGANALDPVALWEDMFKSQNFFGYAGVAIIGMTPIDIACWDIVGKTREQPLSVVFGHTHDKVRAYASGGLFLYTETSALEGEARHLRDQGFKAMKLRLGDLPMSKNIERVEAVRSAIGPEIALMVDVNQGLSVKDALILGRELERFDLAWYEEPIATWDHHGHAELAANLNTPVASGETEYLRFGIRNMIERRSADILMPDLQRLGGFTDFLRSIEDIKAANLRYSPHLFTEHSLHMVTDGCDIVEHMPWFAPLFREKLELDDEGMLELPKRPGIGFTFDLDALDAHLF